MKLDSKLVGGGSVIQPTCVCTGCSYKCGHEGSCAFGCTGGGWSG